MHGHSRELLEVIAVVLVVAVAGIWYFIGQQSATKPPPDSH
jgi:hypothetical protein